MSESLPLEVVESQEQQKKKKTRRAGKRTRDNKELDDEFPQPDGPSAAVSVKEASSKQIPNHVPSEEYKKGKFGSARNRKAVETNNAAHGEEDEDDLALEGQQAEEEAVDATTKPLKIKVQRVDKEYEKDFTKIKLNPLVVTSLQQTFKFEKLTDIQSRTLVPALSGKDLLAEAKTGSGKTLSFLIPMVEMLCRVGWRPERGTGALIIGPTRELCQQIEGVLLRLLAHFNGSITFLCCIGGINRKTEGYKLASGAQIVISTPGRLLDHLRLTTDWVTKNLFMLAVDEADRVLDNGFEEDMRQIIARLPKHRQTFLFSATQTTRVEQLARVSFQNASPVFISLKQKEEQATVDTLDQGYVICPSELRMLLLFQFLRKNQANKKVIVFFSSRNSVSFHAELFNYVDLPCVAFHGKQKQHQRSATYMQFCNAPNGILLTTDVAARGLDIPKVDWIVQFDPPDDPTKYIHRVGRTARAGNCGNALMFLLPSEKLFLSYLKEDANLTVSEFEFDLERLNTNGLGRQLSDLVGGNYYLRHSAKEAYEGYLLSYSASQLKNVFNVQKLDLASVCKGFCLATPPPIKLDLSESAAHHGRKQRKEARQQREAEQRNPQRRRVREQEEQAGGRTASVQRRGRTA